MGADHPAQHNPGRCRAREVLELVADKWSLYVVSCLGTGPRRFTELKRYRGNPVRPSGTVLRSAGVNACQCLETLVAALSLLACVRCGLPQGERDEKRKQAKGDPTWQIGVRMASMSALPVGPSQQEDPLDPEQILRSLPERERETFLAEYRRAVDGANDPAGWPELRRFLRLWAWRAIAVAEPGYYEARELARAGRGGGMLLEDALRQYRPGA